MATLDREREAGGLGVQLEQASKSLFERGGLDLTSAKGFEAKLWEAIRASSSGVILDLGGVTFIDSIGLRVLISAATLAHGAGASSSWCRDRSRSGKRLRRAAWRTCCPWSTEVSLVARYRAGDVAGERRAACFGAGTRVGSRRQQAHERSTDGR